MKEIIISQKDSGQRCDKYLFKIFNNAPKSLIYKFIRKKIIKVNNKKIIGKEQLFENDIIKIYLSDERIGELQAKPIIQARKNKQFDIIYEDDNLLICNKPIGLLSQPKDKYTDSLQSQILSYLIEKNEYDPLKDLGFTPSIGNRLDRNTTGIVIVGKTVTSLQNIQLLLKNHMLQKKYWCIVLGKTKSDYYLKDFITAISKNQMKVTKKPISTDSKIIKTKIKKLATNGEYSLLEVTLVTGKKHQIRAHLASINHPIIGDKKYGNYKINKQFEKRFALKYQLLHAKSITFKESTSYFSYLQNKTFECDLPDKFNNIVNEFFKHQIKL